MDYRRGGRDERLMGSSSGGEGRIKDANVDLVDRRCGVHQNTTGSGACTHTSFSHFDSCFGHDSAHAYTCTDYVTRHSVCGCESLLSTCRLAAIAGAKVHETVVDGDRARAVVAAPLHVRRGDDRVRPRRTSDPKKLREREKAYDVS